MPLDGFSGLTDAQLELRRTGLTATDMVILAGVSPYGTPLEVYEQKLGAPPKPQSLAMQMGHAAEPVIVRALCLKHGLVVTPGETLRHPIMSWMIATPDRFVVNARGERIAVMECKLVGWQAVADWRDEDGEPVFPPSVAVQATCQMGVSKLSPCYVGALLGGWRDDDLHDQCVPWNENLWLGLAELAERWWKDHVEAKRPPTPDGSARAREALQRLYPAVTRKELLPATPDAEALMRIKMDAAERRRAAEREEDDAANKLRALIAEAEGIRGADLKATWGMMPGRVNVDALFEHYKVSGAELEQFRGQPSRTLRVAPLSKADRKGR